MSDPARVRVIAIAREWLGTPFHHGAQVKGVGVDCVNLVASCYESAGVTPHVEIEPYSAQIMLHRGDETVIRYLTRYGREVEAPGAGDVALYKVGKSYSHAGIVVAWPTIIHAHSLSGKVVEMDGRVADLARCLRAAPPRFFSPWSDTP